MNDKLRRIIAIIALIFMSLFTILLIIYLFDKDKTLLNGAVGDLVIWTGAIGLLLSLVMWLSRAFPSQQIKDEERERLYKEAEEMDEAERAKEEQEHGSEESQEQKDAPQDYSRKN